VIYYTQNPTKRQSFWRTRPVEEVRAESPTQAALVRAMRKGRGEWWVTVAEEDPPRSYKNILCRVSGASLGGGAA